ncbi:MAG TPA: acyltransferase [Candidatus Limnocylindria bacterium]|nr:acyltransferase [Candidatus Limnocylindria bacterium]
MTPSPSSSPSVGSRSGDRILELDGIRGFAILLVLGFHLWSETAFSGSMVTPLSNAIRSLFGLGWTGVDLFFVLSGFLLGGILIDHADSPNYYRTFYARRFYRIIPLYFALLIAVGVSRHTLGSKWVSIEFSASFPWLSFFAFLQNFFMAAAGSFGSAAFSSTWSLAVEEQFYLLLPVTMRFVPARKLPFFVVGLAAVTLVVRSAWCLSHTFAPLGAFVLLPFRWDELLLGVLGAMAMRNEALLERLRAQPALLGAFCAISGLILVGMQASEHGRPDNPVMNGIGLSVVGFFYLSLILWALTQPTSWVSGFFRNAGLRWLGKISYGVYLLHLPVAVATHWIAWHDRPLHPDLAHVATTLLGLGLTLALATLSWRFFESKCLATAHKHRY